MTNWKYLHPDFTDELQKEWEDFGFAYEQVEEWIKGYGFSSCDAEFAIYLGDKELVISEMSREELNQLRNEYNKKVKKAVKNPSLKRKSEEIIDPSDWNWKNIHPNFIPELVQEWQECGFSYEEVREWISIGAEITSASFCAWLRDAKKVDAEWTLNHGNIEQLQREHQQCLLINRQIQSKSF